MAVGKLHRISAECQPQQLMTETDAKDGKRAVRQFAQRLDGVIDGGGVAGSVREEQAIGFELTPAARVRRSEEHTSELQSRLHLVCRLLLEKKKKKNEQRQPSTKQ